MKISFLISCMALVAVTSCQNKLKSNAYQSDSLSMDGSRFDSILDGRKVGFYIIENKKGMKATFTNFGGRIISLVVPDKNGQMTDVVVGFDSLKQYTDATEPYFGATIGRYGNRIAKGTFVIDGVSYQAPTNNGVNMLHGGTKGFQYIVWDAEKLDNSTLQFSYLSKDGEMGFPGNLNVRVTYQLTDDGLKISYEAETDKKTIANLTNHAFFNLNGEGSGTILNHKLQVFADKYTPVDSTLIPTGELASVKGTPFDFTQAKAIGTRINEENEQLKNGKGYDHNYVLRETGDNKHAAHVIGDKSGVVMDVYTDQPGLQFYSGNFMKGSNTFKSGAKDQFRTAFCLETQHFPDSPNHPNFPSTELKPGDKLKSISYYKFSTLK